MPRTIVGAGDPKAVKQYSAFMAVDTSRKSYFNKKFMGEGESAQTPLQTLPHLESDAGDQVSYDLVMQLKMKPVQGDNTLRGEDLDQHQRFCTCRQEQKKQPQFQQLLGPGAITPKNSKARKIKPKHAAIPFIESLTIAVPEINYPEA